MRTCGLYAIGAAMLLAAASPAFAHADLIQSNPKANTWFLVDVANGLQSLYSKLLVLKMVLFAGMFALAARHRQRAVPALTCSLSAGEDALTSLRRSLAVEGALGFAVLAVVAWLGTLSPVG